MKQKLLKYGGLFCFLIAGFFVFNFAQANTDTGGFTVTVPSTMPAGTYSATVTVNGTDAYGNPLTPKIIILTINVTSNNTVTVNLKATDRNTTRWTSGLGGTFSSTNPNPLSVSVGDIIDYSWSASGYPAGATATSYFNSSCGNANPWAATDFGPGGISGTISTAQAGCTYNIFYEIKDSSGNVIGAPAGITITVNAATGPTLYLQPNPMNLQQGGSSASFNLIYDPGDGSGPKTICSNGSCP